MKKRTFTYVLALITIVCLLASSASAAAPDTLNGDTIQRRLTYIHSLATTVKISDSGQAICQGRATLNAITNSASLTMKLQRSSNGSSWTRSKHGLRPIPVQFLWKRVGLLRLVTIIKLWSLPKRIRHLAL